MLPWRAEGPVRLFPARRSVMSQKQKMWLLAGGTHEEAPQAGQSPAAIPRKEEKKP